MAKTPKSSGRRRGSSSLQDALGTGQQLIAQAAAGAEDVGKKARDVARDAVTTLEKRSGVELKTLRTRLGDMNTTMARLEREYRSLEKRVERQVSQLSARAAKATDFERRIRTLEADLLRVAGLSPRRAASVKRTVTRKATTAKKVTARKVGAAKRTTARKATAVKKTAARKATAGKKTAARKATAAKRTTARKVTTGKRTAARKTTAAKATATRGAATAKATAARKSSATKKTATRKVGAAKRAAKPAAAENSSTS